LALADPAHAARRLAEAEKLYRCCIDPGNPRRGEALIGLGNCLLRSAANRDAPAAWSAAERFAEAERSPDAEALAAVARHNLQRARLLARQIPTVPPEKQERPPAADESRNDEKPPVPSPEAQAPGESGDGSKAGLRPAKSEASGSPVVGDGPTAPGKGNLPPVPDRDDQPPLKPAAAREHLEQSTRRVIEEARLHRRSAVRPTSPGVRDW
jgi:hypothetical protein